MTQKELNIIEHQGIPFDELDNLSHIVNIEHCNSFTEVIKVYLYGVIQGKNRNRIEEKNQQMHINICYNIIEVII